MAHDYPTLADHAHRMDPDGSIAMIVESLSETNEVLKDMVWYEGNLPTGHQTTRRDALPTVGWRLLNQGVDVDHSTTEQITDTCGIMAAYHEVDKNLAELNGNTAQWRASEATAKLEAMNQEFVSTLFYGNTQSDPEQFHGFTPRYDALSTSSPKVFDGGDSTSLGQSSIWLVCWGPETCFGIFPKGSKAGWQHEDLGRVTIGSSAYHEGYRDYFEWKCGLCIRDPRYVIRYANIDVSDGTASGSTHFLPRYMIKMLHALPNQNVPNKVFYMNSAMIELFDQQQVSAHILTDSGSSYIRRTDGKPFETNFLNFRGVPIRRVDQLTEAEAVVS